MSDAEAKKAHFSSLCGEHGGGRVECLRISDMETEEVDCIEDGRSAR